MGLKFLIERCIIFIGLCAFGLHAQTPREYLECPQIMLSEKLTLESQGSLDPDLQIRNADTNIVASLLIDRDIMFRISGLKLTTKGGQAIAEYQHSLFGRPIFNICTRKQIARVETEGSSGFVVVGMDGQQMYRVSLNTDAAPNGFKIYVKDVLVSQATKSGDHLYRVTILDPKMQKDDLLPLLFGLSVYSMSDLELSEDLKSVDDIVW